jgi:bifunctional DNA-binding transcriptional regulator/antitoxin component of YhaV-PrlF toxin-antitoxin module
MEQTQVLEQGQIVLPEIILRTRNWNIGQKLLIVDNHDGVLLTSKPLFKPTTLNDVAGCLQYEGTAKTLNEMNEAISEGVKKTYANRS